MRTMLALLLTTAIAHADTADVKKMATDDCAKARKANKTCVIDMGNDVIDVDLPKNTGSMVDVIGFKGHESLIRVRRDFIPEILKTAEDL